MKDFNDIDEIFRNQLGDSEVTPPNDLWGKLDQSMDDASFEDMFKQKLDKAEENPPRGIWAALQFKLWMRAFLQFTPAQFNVYYAAAALTVATTGTLVYMAEDEPMLAVAPAIEEIVAETEPVQNQETEVAVFEIREETPAEENDESFAEIAEEEKPRLEVVAPVVDAAEQPKAEPVAPVVEDLLTMSIKGETVLCQNVVETYKASIGGIVSNAGYSWEVDKRYGEVLKTTAEVVSVKWLKKGKTELLCRYDDGKSKAEASLDIIVKEAPEPEFVGKTEMCQGAENVAYYLKFKNRIDYSFIWNVSGNDDYTKPHKARVNVNWNQPGRYIVQAEAIHENGCRVEMEKTVLIHENPTAAFDTQKAVANQVRFVNRSLNEDDTDAGLTYKWEIDGETYTDKSPHIKFTEDKQTIAYLEVEDANGCTDYKKQVFYVKVYSIQVEKMFKPDAGDNFLPISKGLVEYKLEIFDLNHKKLWQTTTLIDGVPVEGWDGTINGEPVGKGRFLWEITARFEDGTKWEGIPDSNGEYRKWGDVDLIR